MKSRILAGKMCVALGMCLVLISIGAYQVHASCSNIVCDTGTCAGLDTTVVDCNTGICSGSGWFTCWGGCNCQLEPFGQDNCVCLP
jgi:hypothetical protein